jgi:hypothetical protein
VETAQLPAVGYVPQTATTTVLKCRVVRLSLGGFQGLFASHNQGEQLFVRLRAASWQGDHFDPHTEKALHTRMGQFPTILRRFIVL